MEREYSSWERRNVTWCLSFGKRCQFLRPKRTYLMSLKCKNMLQKRQYMSIFEQFLVLYKMNKLSSIAPMCSNLGKISPISLTRVLWSLNYCKRNGSQSLPDVSGNLGALGGSQLLLHFWSPFALFFSGIFYKVFLEDGSQGFREENSEYSKFSFLSKNYLS